MPWARAALDLLYPPTCSFCEKRLLPDEQTVCDPCRASMLPADTWRCPRCGATGSGSAPDQGKNCPRCPAPEARYAGVLSVSRYAEPAVRRCVQLFKYNQRLEMGRLMADMMIVRMGNPLRALDDRVEWVVPVPLHWRRRVGRGFNQAGLLAEPLAEALQMTCAADLLRRTRHTRRQVDVPVEQRESNVRGAFEVAPEYGEVSIPGVLLVDDVVTSGATVAECARMLCAAGCPQVWVAAFARG